MDENDRRTVARWQRMWDGWAERRPEPAEAGGYCLPGAGRFPQEVLDKLLEDVRGKLSPSPGCRLLEIGCGGGLYLAPLSAGCALAVGFDLSTVMLNLTRQRCRAWVAQGEAARLPFRDESFDRILCYSVFPSLPSDDYARATLVEIVRVLAPGGRALVGDIPDKALKDKIPVRTSRTGNRDWKNPIRSLLDSPWRGLKALVGSKVSTLDVPEWRAFDRGMISAQLAENPSIRSSFLAQDIPGKYTAAWRFDLLIERD